jgi:uncharacterized protein (DUF2235 family)
MNPPGAVKPKRIVICCDGTDQKLGFNRTNVVRLYGVLDRHNPDEQIDFYQPGVGTMSSAAALTAISRRLTRWAGSMAGYGLLDIVAKGYAFIADHYGPDTQIYLVGFSRGALAARLIGGLLRRFGVLRPGAKNLLPYALELYEQHYTLIRDEAERRRTEELHDEFRRLFCMPGSVRIRFLGVWDTVKAFGIFNPRSFPHIRHNDSIDIVRHALSLDERRRSFMFTSWGGLDRFVEAGPPAAQDVEEVWFAGVHSDVGGGYPEEESGLSWHAFRWMLGEARLAGMKLDDDAIADVLKGAGRRAHIDPQKFHERHESRTLRWRLLDGLPRLELKNAPPRAAWTGDLPRGDNLPVPAGWPKREFTFWPWHGHRDPNQYPRNNAVRVHRSVEPFVKAGRYQIENAVYVDDEPPYSAASRLAAMSAPSQLT